MMQTHNIKTTDERPATMSLFAALLPYVVLMIAALVVLVPEPVNGFLGLWRIGLPFPAVTSGYEVTRPAAEPYAPFAPLTHPGSFLLLAAVVTAVYYRARGFYAQVEEPTGQRSILGHLVRDAVPSSLAIIAFLILSKYMDHSGQTDTLARGIATGVPSGICAALAPTLGVLGAFMTSSNTASNVLFAPVQETIAVLAGLPIASIIAGQNAGAAIGNAIAPANIVLGTGPAGIQGQEGKVLRRALPYALVATFVTGAGVWLLVTITRNGG